MLGHNIVAEKKEKRSEAQSYSTKEVFIEPDEQKHMQEYIISPNSLL